jgi:hypothetical protein
MGGWTASSTTLTKTLDGPPYDLVVDGFTLSVGDRLLVKDQATASENGVYALTSVDGTTHVAILTRAADYNTVSSGVYVYVESGTANHGSGWVLTNTGTITIGTTLLTFTLFSGSNNSGITETTTDILTNKTMSSGCVWNGGVMGKTYGGTGISSTATFPVSGTVAVVEPISIVTSNTTAVSGTHYIVNAITANVTITLPLTDDAHNGKYITVTSGRDSTYSVIIAPSESENLGALAVDATFSITSPANTIRFRQLDNIWYFV